MNDLQEIVNWATRKFANAKLFYGHGTDNPRDEAVYLIFSVLKLPYDEDAEIFSRRINQEERVKIIELVKRRINERKPIAYLINEAWFMGLKFFVDERVLIPRSPIAELVENKFQPWMKSAKINRILDLGTGSGCIAIACAEIFSQAKIDAVDISPDALEVAKININNYKLNDRVKLIESDLFAKLSGHKYDIIIANPPYVDAREMEELPKEYKHEPHLALAGGEDGLLLVEKILFQAHKYLNQNGILAMDVGASMYPLIEKYPNIPFIWPEFQNGGDGVFILEDLGSGI